MSNEAKHTRGPWEFINEPEFDPNRHRWFYLVTCLHGIHKIEGSTPEEAKANAELIAKAPEMAAEIERLKDIINTYLDAVHSIAHKRIDLQDVVDAIRGVSNQTEEIDRQAAELSKLRQENERYKEALQCMMNVEHHGDFMNAFFDLKDQVKAALQGE